MKNNTLIIIGLILIIIVCVLFVFSGQSTPTPSLQNSITTTNTTKTVKATTVKTTTDNQPIPQTTGYVVYYTDNGFSPASIQVPQGKLVKFINNSNKALLIVADGNAPSELNESKSIGKGGVYTFNFTYTGVWAFHNADFPADHGNIVVY